MKKAIFLLLAVLINANVYAQAIQNKNLNQNQIPKNNQFAFSAGPSFAIGDFGDNNSGGAGIGVSYYLSFNHMFSEQFGIGLKLFGNANKFNTEDITNQMTNSTGIPFRTDNCSWYGGGFLVGLVEHLAVSEKFIFDIKFLIGYISINSPEIKSYPISSPSSWVKMVSASSGTFGYDLGAGFSFLLKPKWNLLINIDFLKSELNPNYSLATLKLK